MEDNKYARFLKNSINTRNLHKLKPSHIRATLARLTPVNTSGIKDAIKGSFTKLSSLTQINRSEESSSDSKDSDYEERLEQYQQMYHPEESEESPPEQQYPSKYGATSWPTTGLRSPPDLTPKAEEESDPPSNASTGDSSSSSSSSAKQSSSSPKASTSSAKGSSSSTPTSSATSESHESSISAPQILPPWRPFSYTQARMVPSANWSPKSGSFIYHSRSASRLTKKVSFSDEQSRLRHQDSKIGIQSRSRREEAPIPNIGTNLAEKPSELTQKPSDMLKEQISSYLMSEFMPDEKPSDILVRDKRGKFYTIPGKKPKFDMEAQLSSLLSMDDNKVIYKPSSELPPPASIMKPPSTGIPQVRSSVETVASVVSLGHRFTEPAENSRNRSVNVSGKPIPNSNKSSNTEKKKRKKIKLKKCHRPRLQMETNLDWVKTYLQYPPKPLPPPPKKTKKEAEEDKALKELHDKLQENADKLNAVKNRIKVKDEEDVQLYKYDGNEPHKGQKPPTSEILSRGKPTTNLQTIYTYLTVVDNSGSEAELFVDPNKPRNKKGKKKSSGGEEFIIMFAAEDKDTKDEKKESSSETDTGLMKEKQTNTKKKRLKRMKKKKEARKKLTTRLVTNICFMKTLFIHCWSREGLKPDIITKEVDHTEDIDWTEKTKVDPRVDRPTNIEYYVKKNITLDTVGHVHTVTKFNSENRHPTSKSFTDIYLGEEHNMHVLPKSMSVDESLFRTNLNRCYIVNPVFVTRKKSARRLLDMPKAKAKPELQTFYREKKYIVGRCCHCSGGVTAPPGPDGCEARKPRKKTSREGEKHHYDVLSEDTDSDAVSIKRTVRLRTIPSDISISDLEKHDDIKKADQTTSDKSSASSTSSKSSASADSAKSAESVDSAEEEEAKEKKKKKKKQKKKKDSSEDEEDTAASDSTLSYDSADKIGDEDDYGYMKMYWDAYLSSTVDPNEEYNAYLQQYMQLLEASTPKNEKPVIDGTTSGENILNFAAQNKKQRLLGILESGARKAISEDHLRKIKRMANMLKQKFKLDKPEPSNTTLYEVNFQTSSYSLFDRAHSACNFLYPKIQILKKPVQNLEPEEEPPIPKVDTTTSDYVIVEDTGPKLTENFTPGEALDDYHKDPDADEMTFYDCKREFMEKVKNGITIVHEMEPTNYDEEDDYRNYDDTPLTRTDRELATFQFFAETTSDSNSSIHIPSRKYSERVRERNFEADLPKKSIPKKSIPARTPRYKSGKRRKSRTQVYRAQSSSSSCHYSPHRRKSVTFDWTFNEHTPIERGR